MKCKDCEANGEYGCRAGFTSIVINGELGCRDADRAMDAFHFNQVKDNTRASTYTNADRIRAMTDEELAVYIRVWFPEVCPPGDCPGEDYCYKCWLDWLRQEESDG